MNKIISLKIKNVTLEPMCEDFYERLEALAQEPSIWQSHAHSFHQPEIFRKEWFEDALEKMKRGERIAYVIMCDEEVVGSTSYYHMNAKNKTIDIGYTWLHPRFWGTGINDLAKYILLQNAFENFEYNRVGFCVDSNNKRSCKAVQKLGAKLEGVLRNHLIRADKTIRHTAVFSIIREEWPDVKSNFEKKSLLLGA